MPKDKELQRQYNNERRQWLRDHGICVRCGNADAEPGMKYCNACLAHDRARHEGCRDRDNKRRRALRQERINAGLCIACGKRATPGMRMCSRCRARQADSVRKYRIIKKIDREAERARANNGQQ